MTEYDEVVLSTGGPHPLAGVPQEALDAARSMFSEIARTEALPLDHEEADAVADSVLMAGIVALRKTHLIVKEKE